MNPETNRLEPLTEKVADAEEKHDKTGEALRRQMQDLKQQMQQAPYAAPLLNPALLRADGTAVPAHWPIFQVGEDIVVRDYTFRVAYIGETTLLLEPVGPLVIDPKKG